ncbi:hypothetical protein EV368DRAFT_63050 [Lentinula lateritia]|nr:hypothetical protein EV368DRAFT_63050 [Lentinula lateritia]
MALGPAEVADRAFIHAYVIVVFVADTTHTIFIMAYMYLSLVKHFGDIPYISDSTWVFAAEPALVGIIGGLVQSFYGWRVQILLGNWFVTLIIFVGALANMLMGIATAIGADIVKAFSEFQRFQVVVIIWAVTAMAADLIIMATLVLHLRHFKTGINKGTDNQIDRIFRSSIDVSSVTLQTGMITVIWDIAHLLTFLLDPAGVLTVVSYHSRHLFFNFTLAKLYTNSLLSSLNSRGGWKFMDSTSDHNTITTGRSGIYTEHGVSQHVEVNLGHHTRSRPEVFIQVESHEMMDQNQKGAAIDSEY